MQFLKDDKVEENSTKEIGFVVHTHLMSRTTLVRFDAIETRWINNENLTFISRKL